MDIKSRIIQYISRYAPSRDKLTTYLGKKKVGEVEKLLVELGYDEVLMIDMWMRTFIALGKGRREISMKLRSKGFDKGAIDVALARFEGELSDWSEYQGKIELQIDTLSRRGKSKQMMFSTLREKYPYFRDEITELFEVIQDDDSLEKEMQKYKNKYNLSDPKDKQKCITSLIRKGYRYDDIKRSLHRNEDV